MALDDKANDTQSQLKAAEKRLKEVMTLPSGWKVYAFSPEHVAIIEQMIDDRIWWEGTWQRMKRIGVVAGAVTGALVLLANWWPWVTRVMQAILPDVPKP